MSRFNPALAKLAFHGIEKVAGHTKRAFVPMGPDAQIAQQQAAQEQQMAQQQQAAQGGGAPAGGPPAPGGDPAAAGMAALMGGGGGGGAPAPEQAPQGPPAQPQPQQPQQQNPMNSPDDIRAMLKEELAAHDEKPAKLSVADRLTQLEGMVLRMMEQDGKVKPDPNLIQPATASAVDSGGMPGGTMPQVGDAPAPPPASTPGMAGMDPMAGAGGAGAAPGGGMGKMAAAREYLNEMLVRHGYSINVPQGHTKQAAADLLAFGRVSDLDKVVQSMPLTGLDADLPPVPELPGLAKQSQDINAGLQDALKKLRRA